MRLGVVLVACSLAGCVADVPAGQEGLVEFTFDGTMTCVGSCAFERPFSVGSEFVVEVGGLSGGEFHARSRDPGVATVTDGLWNRDFRVQAQSAGAARIDIIEVLTADSPLLGGQRQSEERVLATLTLEVATDRRLELSLWTGLNQGEHGAWELYASGFQNRIVGAHFATRDGDLIRFDAELFDEHDRKLFGDPDLTLASTNPLALAVDMQESQMIQAVGPGAGELVASTASADYRYAFDVHPTELARTMPDWRNAPAERHR